MEKNLLYNSQVCVDTAGEAKGLDGLCGGSGVVIYEKYTRFLVDLYVSLVCKGNLRSYKFWYSVILQWFPHSKREGGAKWSIPPLFSRKWSLKLLCEGIWTHKGLAGGRGIIVPISGLLSPPLRSLHLVIFLPLAPSHWVFSVILDLFPCLS